jgi:YD repeat-containing protein
MKTVTTAYNTKMQPTSLCGTNTYFSNTNYDAAGRILSRTLGNTLPQSYAYYPWNQQAGRMQNLVTGTLQNLTYQYDAAGNITQIEDSVARETQDFVYDTLDRLTEWKLNGNPQERYTYNGTTGNLTGKAGVTLSYTDSNHDHAVTGAGGNSYGYDANGKPDHMRDWCGYFQSKVQR